MFIRAYLRASTSDQNAERAKPALENFANSYQKQIAAWYIENESGTTAERTALSHLLADAHTGDIMLIEQVDRLTRLPAREWESLKVKISAAGIRIVSLDLPTSYLAMQNHTEDDFMCRLLDAMNQMLLDVLAAVARKDYEDRRRRQREGIQTAKEKEIYRGRPANMVRHQQIRELRQAGFSLTQIQKHTNYSKSQICRILKQLG